MTAAAAAAVAGRKLKTFLQTDLMFMFVRSFLYLAQGREGKREQPPLQQPRAEPTPFSSSFFAAMAFFSLHGRMEITLVDSHKREREGGKRALAWGREKNKISLQQAGKLNESIG